MLNHKVQYASPIVSTQENTNSNDLKMHGENKLWQLNQQVEQRKFDHGTSLHYLGVNQSQLGL